MNLEQNALNLEDMEYCYCHRCGSIKAGTELIATDEGLKCCQCGSYNLEEPGWVRCPYQKMSAVKCPRSGKGIINNGLGLECTDRCFFRAKKPFLINR